MIKHWKVLILFVMLVGSILAIGFKPVASTRGVEILLIAENSSAENLLQVGSIITHINAEQITNRDDFVQTLLSLYGKSVTLTVDGREVTVLNDEQLGLTVGNIDKTNLDLGLDLKGGTRIILKPEGNLSREDMDQLVGTLETRTNLYGLKEIRFVSLRDLSGETFIQAEAAGLSGEVLESIIARQGKFEAKVIKPVRLIAETGTLTIGSRAYEVTLTDDGVEIDGREFKADEEFVLDDLSLVYAPTNNTQSSAIFFVTVYSGDDIQLVLTDPQNSGVLEQGSFVSFFFSILVGQEGAQRFADVTADIPKLFDISTGEEYLDSAILLYLDGELVSELRIGGSLGGQVVETIQISGSRSTLEEALQEKLELQTILRSGALPTTLETLSIDTISPTLGSAFFSSALVAALGAGIVVVVIVFARYRRLKIALPLAFISFSEILIIVGLSAQGDQLIWGGVIVVNLLIIAYAAMKKQQVDMTAWIGAFLIPAFGLASWTIDLPAIAGLIAAIGTGVDHQLIIADEALGRKEAIKFSSIKDKIKRAFFIIFGSAATTISAMLPLVFIGVGLVRGFAITTIIGVLIGIMITRPVYSKIVESVAKD